MWEPPDWVLMREQRVQSDIAIPSIVIEHLSSMAAQQSEEIVGHLRGNMNELADRCIMRTQFLAVSVCGLSNSHNTIMEYCAQHFLSLNEVVGQVQYLTGSERQLKASMEQG